MKILIPWDIADFEKDYLESHLPEDELVFVRTTSSNDIPKELLSGVEVIIAGLADRKLIEGCPDLKLIQSMIAAVSHIDLLAASEKNLLVSSVKGANSPFVAEHTMMLMLNLAKNTKTYFSQEQAGLWEKHYSQTLYGKMLGIVGLGNIGTQAAKLASSFGMAISAIRYHPKKGDNGLNLSYLGGKDSLPYLAEISDYLLVSVPKTKETLSLIGKSILDNMNPMSNVINISRGPIVDIDAIYQALLGNKIAGFAADVHEPEPSDYSHPIYRLPNVITTPHVAAYIHESKIRCLEKVVENINSYKNNIPINTVDFSLGY